MSLTCPPLPLGLTPAPRDPVSITTLPRLLTLLLSLTVPAVSHTLPPAAWALCQLLPTTAILRACSEPHHTSCCCSSEVAHWEPQSCLSLGWVQPSQSGQLCCGEQGWSRRSGLMLLPQPAIAPGCLGGRGLCSWDPPPTPPDPSVDSIS